MSDVGVSTAEVLTRWHAAVGAGDMEGVVGLCSEDVAVLGPRGLGHGHDLVRGWWVRSGIRLEPLEPFVERDARVVVRERARWTTADAEPAETWCVFTVAAGRVTGIARYGTADEVPPA